MELYIKWLFTGYNAEYTDQMPCISKYFSFLNLHILYLKDVDILFYNAFNKVYNEVRIISNYIIMNNLHLQNVCNI